MCRNCVLKLLKDCAQFAAETAKNEQEQDFFSMVDSKIKYEKKKEKYSFTENWRHMENKMIRFKTGSGKTVCVELSKMPGYPPELYVYYEETDQNIAIIR